MEKFHSDLVIIGGGIAGLWLFRRLRDAGHHVVLIEKNSLGCGQTLASQGMVHGGQRYALQGKLTNHSESIAAMPSIWDECLKGQGEVDLSSAELLSDTQVMWSPGGIGSDMTAFMASKAMNGRVTKLDKYQQSDVFEADQFKGSVYQLDESVLNISSVLESLVGDDGDLIYQASIKEYKTSDDGLSALILGDGEQEIKLSANEFVFAAGQGNEEVIKALGVKGQVTQRRPLKQVLVKGVEHDLFGHCIGTSQQPRMTVTTHPCPDGDKIWYLGGQVAGYGLDKSDEEAIAHAKEELEKVFPWLDWQNKQWSTLAMDRAEPCSKGARSDGPTVNSYGNVHVAWPTKLTFAPGLTQKIIDKILITKGEGKSLPLKKAVIGEYIWNKEKQWLSL